MSVGSERNRLFCVTFPSVGLLCYVVMHIISSLTVTKEISKEIRTLVLKSLLKYATGPKVGSVAHKRRLVGKRETMARLHSI